MIAKWIDEWEALRIAAEADDRQEDFAAFSTGKRLGSPTFRIDTTVKLPHAGNTRYEVGYNMLSWKFKVKSRWNKDHIMNFAAAELAASKMSVKLVLHPSTNEQISYQSSTYKT
ncbi:hypothetical protein CIHG_06188 [Coccidioides immitis H538.4]|uniref:Uncharacterized protein n=3 Tax=Coccidioides immitis TaxID=5501 RepID=A0A0J8QUN9_COCIT|nr:hypothetical protein CIRG_00124 [Coccidioides immitis RMSCC 2394]KMU75795.1 hypothetical protein CISG_05192 [Coccidioides immitis RMSCC 3703]KMU88390.1 hypothetical protein CIHG_06188 [Coccidioides immitis H538.4]